MKRTLPLYFLALGLLLNSCATVKVATKKEEHVDYEQYKTYSFMGWAANSDRIMSNEDKKLVHQAFRDEFDRRGLEFVRGGGDMMVSLFIVVDEESAVSGYNDYVGRGAYMNSYYSTGYGWGYGYSPTSNYKSREYMVGTLVMDVYDAKGSKQIWQGIASGTIKQQNSSRAKRIRRTVASLMRRFPMENR